MLQEFNLSKKENGTYFHGRAAKIRGELENPISVFLRASPGAKHNALCGIRTEHAHFTFTEPICSGARVDAAQNLLPHQILGHIERSNLSRGFLIPSVSPNRWITHRPGFWIFCSLYIQHRSYAHIDFFQNLPEKSSVASFQKPYFYA